MKTSILKVKDNNTGTVHSVPALKGESAYQSALKGGYSGTKEEFYQKLGQPIDETPIENSNNLISSGGVYSALNDEIIVKYKGVIYHEFNIQYLEKKKGNLYLFIGGDSNIPPYSGLIYDGEEWREFRGYRQPSETVENNLIDHPSGAAVIKYVAEQLALYDNSVMSIIGEEG